jgi:hypothetical protein
MANFVELVTQGGGYTSPTLVVADVAFDASGDASVTAASLGLRNIKGFAAGAWGGTTNAVAAVYSDTTYTAAGVTTISLEARESDAGTDADLNVTVPVLFWGDKQ